VADIGEEESFGDGDVGGVLVGGGVGGALVGVPFQANMGIAALLLVVPLLFSPLSLLVVIPVTITRQRAFSDKMTGLTLLVTNLLGTGLVIFPLPLLEDLTKALDDECHLLIVELEASMGTLLGVESSFFSSVALNATGCTSGVEEAPCSMIFLEPLIINSKLTNFPITSSGDISLYLGSPRIN
jgi:hypothetical protein